MSHKQFAIVSEKVRALQCPAGPDGPELLILCKPTVAVDDEHFVADSVVRVQGHVVVVEHHDTPTLGPGSGRRERLLREANVPIVRLYGREVAEPATLRRKLRAVVCVGVN